MSNSAMERPGFGKVGAAYHISRRLSPDEGFHRGPARRSKGGGLGSREPPGSPGAPPGGSVPERPRFCTVSLELPYPLFLSLFLLAFAKGRTTGEEAAEAVERHIRRAKEPPGGGHVN